MQTTPNNTETQAVPKPKSRRWLWGLIGLVVIVLIGGGVAGWYYYYGPCGVVAKEKAQRDLEQGAKELDAVFTRWQDAVTVAGSTSRGALSTQIAALQEIRRDAESLELPVCLELAQAEMIASMNSSLDGFLAFMQNKSDSLVNTHFDAAVLRMTNFSDELVAARECVSTCSPK